jgi:hypothetical protein
MAMNEEVNPFQSPEFDSKAPVAGGQHRQGKNVFVSGHARAVVAMGMLGLVMFATLLAAVMNYLQIRMVQTGGLENPMEVLANERRMGLVNIFFVTARLACNVAFICWFYRANSNLRALGDRNVDYSPGWTVGAWFIPIGNLFIPYQMMVEIWKGSDPKSVDPSRPMVRPSLALVRWWWAFFIGMCVLGWICVQRQPTEIQEVLSETWLSLYLNLVTLAAAVLAILVVQKVDANQEKRNQLVQELGLLTPKPVAVPAFLDDVGEQGLPPEGATDGAPLTLPADEDSARRNADDPIKPGWLDE